MEGALRESQTLGNREYVPGISSFSTSATLGVEWRSCMFIIPAEQKGRTQSFTLPVSLAAAGSPLFLKETVEIPSCVALFYYTDGSKGLDPIFHLFRLCVNKDSINLSPKLCCWLRRFTPLPQETVANLRLPLLRSPEQKVPPCGFVLLYRRIKRVGPNLSP